MNNFTNDFDKASYNFNLPKELIAQHPIKERTSSKLMVLHKQTGCIEHKKFSDITNYLKQGDCIVLNDTKVMTARLKGQRMETGAKIELLLLKKLDKQRYEVLVNPGKKAREGDVVVFEDGKLKAFIEEVVEGGNRIVRFEHNEAESLETLIDTLGEMPLPPYIKERLEDKNRYQTVYAKNSGSAAAPTAGLHFTDKLLSQLSNKGIKIAKLTLHVGLGTFRPVKVENILEHKMHTEFYSIEQSQADIINNAKKSGGKIVAVGTTSCRTLESVADENGFIKAGSGNTDIFIYPSYKLKVVDSLITNFHLPESTLIMLVSAFCGREKLLFAYEQAVSERYRFFSFGDAMFVTD